MAHRLGDRVQDATTSYNGTGNMTITGAALTGRQSVDSLCTSDGDTIDLVIDGGGQWEFTRCTRVSPGLYSRANPPWASSTGSQVSFTTGVKEIHGDLGAFFAEHLNTVEIAIASATTVDIGAARGKFVAISGTTGPTTSLGTAAHKERVVRHSGSVWTCNTTSLILQGLANGVNRTNVANAISHMKSDAAGNWRELSYQLPTAAAPLDALAFNGIQINGVMEVSQENGASGVTLTATGSLQTKYLVDGVMAAYRGTFVAAGQQVSDAPNGYNASLKFTVGTAQSSLGSNDELSVFIPVEGVRASRLAFGTAGAAAVSFAFWVKAHRTGAYSGSLRNSAKARSYPFSFTVNVADTWEYKTVTVSAGDMSGTWLKGLNVGLYLAICIAGGSSRLGTAAAWAGADYSGTTGSTNGVAATSDVFQITGLVVLPGIELPPADRAPFIMRSLDQELTVCKRYWRPCGGTFAGRVNSATVAEGNVSFDSPVMRATPSVAFFQSGYVNEVGVAARIVTGVSYADVGPSAAAVAAIVAAGGMTAPNFVSGRGENFLKADARL